MLIAHFCLTNLSLILIVALTTYTSAASLQF